MVIILTGNGKGKTSAALGLALRAVGRENNVLMVQFIKGPWLSGEHESCKKLDPKFKIIKTGKGFVGIGDDKRPRSEHVKAAEDGLALAEKEAMSGAWNVLILDEIWNALSLRLLTHKKISEFIEITKPLVDHLILTGRGCTPEFIAAADLVTEMREIKHPFSKGVPAAAGIDF
jgi:cob(I)alamin adenosyltransferase